MTVQDLERTDWYNLHKELINSEFEKLAANRHDNRPNLEKEEEALSNTIRGLSQSLGDPDLKPNSRTILQENLEQALSRKKDIQSEIAQIEATTQQFETIVSPEKIVDRLNRLHEVLGANNPSQTNLELSLHIDRIIVFPDGRVTIRTCKLGALAECKDLIQRNENQIPPSETQMADVIPAKPRKRALRALGAGSGDRKEQLDAAHHASDVNRFSGLGPEWFWEDTFQLEPKIYPFQEMAEAVAVKKAETGWSYEKLAKHFQVSIPTVRKAFRYAQKQPGAETEGLPKAG